MNRRTPIVADRFSAAAARYDSIARAQREAAARFADWLAEHSAGDRPARIVELGCGTGFFTAHLLDRWPDATVLATDLAPAMAVRCAERFAGEPRLETGCADAARARFSPTPDWVVSTMCLQWVRPLEAVLDMHLSQCRVLAFSLLLDGSFAAWRDAHERAGLDCGLQPMLRADDLAALCARLAAAHGRRCEFEQVSIDEPHADGLAFARALRGIGADVARAGHRPVPLRRVLVACATPLVMNYELAFVRIAP